MKLSLEEGRARDRRNRDRQHALRKLKEVSDKFPDLRVCQLIGNLDLNKGISGDYYYVTDAKLFDALNKFMDDHVNKS